jgi:hypothetical protein
VLPLTSLVRLSTWLLNPQIDLDSLLFRHAERRHANLAREGREGTGNMGTGHVGTGVMTRDPYDTQAAAGHHPTTGTMPGTHQQFGAYTGSTAAAVPPPGQPRFDQGLYNTADPADPRFAPSTGQKASVCHILSIV